ncbi:MAG: hypothetical protein H6650_01295 [Ardenticatenales bacterium]|nr:hypothetical protein [Ardenticatenales bacterium]
MGNPLLNNAGAALAQETVVTLQHTIWVHGSSAQLQFASSQLGPAGEKSLVDATVLVKQGQGARMEAVGTTLGNFVLHFPLSTPTFGPGGQRLRLQSVLLDFQVARNAVVTEVSAWDGNRRVARFANLGLAGTHSLEVLSVDELPVVMKGIDIAVTVRVTEGQTGVVVFHAAGIQLATVSNSGQVLAPANS